MPLISLEPDHLDMTVVQGASFHFQHRYVARGRVMALTGYHAKMSVARRPGSPVLVQLTTENGGLLLESNGVPGMIDIKMTPEETQALSRDSQYDLLLEAPDGEVVRALEGTVFVRRAVST